MIVNGGDDGDVIGICVRVTFHYVPKALIWYNIDDRRYPYE